MGQEDRLFTFFLIVAFTIITPAATGQAVTVEPEITVAPATARYAQEAPVAILGAGLAAIELPPPLPDELSDEDRTGAHKSMLRVGAVRELPDDSGSRTLSATDWIPCRDGARAWSLSVSSPGAHALRLRVAVKDMPENARLVCYDAYDSRSIFGPWAAKELQEAGLFWTPSIFSNSVVLEWQLPPDTPTAEGAFLVDSVAHTFFDPKDLMQVGSCHNDISCATAAWRTRGTGIARISFVDGGGQYICSGALINDSDPQTQVPYFMTAYHCISSSTVAATVEFYWLYQTSTCNGAPPSLGSVPRTTGGAAYLQGRSTNDFALLRVNNSVPGGLTMLGWTTAIPSIGSEATCIHHPQGSHKRISYGSFITRTVDSANLHQVRYSSGSTEGGSSGSPIFNTDGYFVGQLKGGNAACDYMSGYDVFGRFDVTWPYVRQWLEGGIAASNDNCANAIAISGSSGTVSGSNAGASKETGEPNHGNNAGGASVWWVWTAPFSGEATIETCGSDFDTTLGAYTGSCGSLSSVAQDDDGCNPQSRVTFNAAAGTAYRIAVDGYNGSTGSVVLAWNLEGGNPILTVSPTSRTAGTEAGSTTFTVRNDGTGTMAWSASHSCNWLTLTPSTGSLTSGQSRDVAVTYQTNAGGTRSCIVPVSAPAASGSPLTFTLDQAGEADRPANDDCANAIPLSGASGTVSGSNVAASKEPGEPNHGSRTGGASVWWVWTAPFSGEATIETCGSDFDTTLGVYSGNCTALNSVAQNDDGCVTQSRVTFNAAAGTAYRIAVDGYNGSSGDIALSWSHTQEFPALGVTPSNHAVGAGAGSTSFTVRNDGGGDMPWSASHACAWVSLSPSNGTLGASESLDVSVTYQANTGAARNCAVTVAASGATGSPKTFTLNQATGDNRPANDNCANAVAISGPGGSRSGSNAGATKEPGEPNHAGNAGGASVWWAWTAPSNGTATVETCGSNFDTTLAVYTGNCGSLGVQAQNDDACGPQSRVTFGTVAGTVYRIAVDGYNGSTGSIALTWSHVAAVPVLTVSPTAWNAVAGSGSATFTVRNEGEGTMNWSASTSCGWVSLVPSSGALGAGGSREVSAAYQANAGGARTCTVTVSAAGATGSPRTFTLGQEAAGSRPANDDCAGAATLSGASGTVTGSNVGATIQSGEPNHGNNAGGASVWWAWTPPSSGTATVETCGSSFDTTLGVYTGNCGALTSVAQDDDDCGQQSRTTFDATAGTTYRIAVDGFDGSAGNITLTYRLDSGIPSFPGCAGCLPVSGKGSHPLEDLGRWLGDFVLIGVSLLALLAMAWGYPPRRL